MVFVSRLWLPGYRASGSIVRATGRSSNNRSADPILKQYPDFYLEAYPWIKHNTFYRKKTVVLQPPKIVKQRFSYGQKCCVWSIRKTLCCVWSFSHKKTVVKQPPKNRIECLHTLAARLILYNNVFHGAVPSSADVNFVPSWVCTNSIMLCCAVCAG